MRAKVSAMARRITSGLASRWCWRIVLVLFLLEGLWFVFSARYPMAFDENYHYGLIKLHAEQWLPFFTAQPHDANVYGAVVRDPSYLYHWLMSFPYRFIALFTGNQTIQVISLRLLNVAMFAGGLVLYRRIVRRMGASQALTNALFAVFVMIPVVPFLAATINYDNLFFVAVALTTLLTLKLIDGFADKRVDAPLFLSLLAVLFLSSLIKYPFLPVFVVVVCFLTWRLWRDHLLGRSGLKSLVTSFGSATILKRVALVLACLLSLALFAERYGQNIITYHNPVPACDAVISQDECQQYGPYGRDHILVAQKPTDFDPNPVVYGWEWLWGMWYRLFFTISDTYATAPPMLDLAYFAVACAVLLGAGIVLRARTLFAGHPGRQLLFWLTVGYTLVLFADGLQAYANTGQPVAINGRYLIPFLPFIFVLGGLAWSQILRHRPVWKASAATLVIAIFLLQGGGAMTFIVRSTDDWLWPNSTVRAINRTVRSAAWHEMLGRGDY